MQQLHPLVTKEFKDNHLQEIGQITKKIKTLNL